MAHLPRRLSSFAAASVLALTLTACSGSDEADPESSSPESSESPSAEDSASESESATPTATPSPSRTPKKKPSRPPTAMPPEPTEPAPTNTPGPGAAPAAMVGHLLTAEQLPGLNDRTVWKENATGPSANQPFGDCQKASLTDIGAQQVAVRTFHAHGSQAGAQMVAQFADAKSAWRAHQVLKSWRKECKQELQGDVRKVGPLSDVPTSRGVAQSYLLQFGNDGEQEHNFHGVGITRVAETLSIVTIDVRGQDYNYEPGREPASLAAAAAADRL